MLIALRLYEMWMEDYCTLAGSSYDGATFQGARNLLF